MRGTVEVVEPGTAGLTTQAEVDQGLRTHMAGVVEPLLGEIMAERGQAVKLEGPAGADLWFVRAGTSARTTPLDIDAFLPDTLAVRQGDTVAWAVDHLVPHTVTFLATGAPRPATWAVGLPDGTLLAPGQAPPDPSVPLRMVNLSGRAVRPGPTYDGRSYYSSGTIGGDPVTPRGIAWALTFDTPGSYEYLCLLHDAHGMKGEITVLPR
jgi:plastocyanin